MLESAFPEVLAGARAGDGPSWARILDDLSGPLLGFARGRGVEDPEDVLGETLLSVARGLEGFDGDESGFRAWVFTIAHRRVVDAQRRRHRRPSTLLPAEDLAPLAEALDASDDEIVAVVERLDSTERLDALLAHLTDEQREVLVLRFVADLDATTVGCVTGRSTNAVAAITRRALLRLEEVISGEAAGASPVDAGGR